MELTEKRKRMKTTAIGHGVHLARGDYFGPLMKRLENQKTISTSVVEDYLMGIIDAQKEIACFIRDISREL